MHFQRSKTASRTRAILPFLPVLFALLLLLAGLRMPNSISTTSHRVAEPFWNLRTSLVAALANVTTSFETKETLVAQNRILLAELASLRREAYTKNAIERENDVLRAALGRSHEHDLLVPTTVVNDSRFSAFDTFVVDIGADDGMREGMLVVSEEGVALGVIERTMSHSSLVKRFSAPAMRAWVSVQATSSIHALIEGHGGNTMRMSVPRDVPLAVGDPVILPNYAGNLIGYIVGIDMAPEDAYQTVYVGHPTNQYQIRHVFVDVAHMWKFEAEDPLDTLGGPQSSSTP